MYIDIVKSQSNSMTGSNYISHWTILENIHTHPMNDTGNPVRNAQ